jgi:8-oxo-dGTP pyrophosphatase MutT (NUDIX family)
MGTVANHAEMGESITPSRTTQGQASTATGATPERATVVDVADMLRDEYEAIHGPLPVARPQMRTSGGTSLAAAGAAAANETAAETLDAGLRAFYASVHRLPKDVGRSALCLSGGGIRSASFSLGVLQALARNGVLQRFHYLSTVSGGGYIGSWLTAWIHRHFTEVRPSPPADDKADTPPSSPVATRSSPAAPLPRSERLGEVSALLASSVGGRSVGGDRPPEPEQVAHLRRFTNYLSPRTGAFSLDTWTLVAIYLRNLLLNWLVIVPLLSAALIVPWLGVVLLRVTALVPAEGQAKLATIVTPVLLSALVWLVLIATTVLRRRFTNVGIAESLSRWEARALMFGASWAAFGAIVLYGPSLLDNTPTLTGAGLSGIGTYVLKKLGDRANPPGGEVGRPARMVRAATTVAALLTIVLILAALSSVLRVTVAWTAQWSILTQGSFSPEVARLVATVVVIVAALGISALAATVVDINEYSLHALYRNRLVRAFLRASRGADAPRSDNVFSEKDDLPLVRLWPRAAASGDPADAPHLYHVINATLNDLGGSRPEWNERKGVSFTFSPLHIGAHIAGRYQEDPGAMRGGYRRLTRVGDEPDAMRLGTAMSISGAAASPNMGYHSSPVVSFLMALFNVRLGWWMRPPWQDGRNSSTLPSNPRAVWRAWWAEAFGGTRFTSSVLNVSDGGHFDNLGLYEMVRRRCRYVVVVDGGQDRRTMFDSLAEVIRRVRVDFGIPITMTGLDLSAAVPARDGANPPPHAYYGTIHYSKVDSVSDPAESPHFAPAPDGELVYIKPRISGDEPVDVQSYHKLHPEFPHETTADQWFSESQFESYRALGEHSVQHLLDYYNASKGKAEQAEDKVPDGRLSPLSPMLFCHRVAESLALMRRHKESSSHAGGVVYRRRGGRIEFLLVKSGDQQFRVLPKGYIEPWEDAAKAAQREVLEEAGLDLVPRRSLGVSAFTSQSGRVTTTYFLMEDATEKPEPEPLEDFRAPAWLTIENARRVAPPVPDDVIHVLEKAQDLLASHAGGILYRVEDGGIHFLLVKSKDQSARVLPKGHIESGEDPATAAAREVREETGYRVRSSRSLGVTSFEGDTGPITAKYFLIDEEDAQAGVGDEPSRDPQWITLAQARGADLAVPEDVIALLKWATEALAPGP